jgi:hypothetical protein
VPEAPSVIVDRLIGSNEALSRKLILLKKQKTQQISKRVVKKEGIPVVLNSVT